MPKYPEALQCGLVLARDEYAHLLRQGIENMRALLLRSHLLFHDFAAGLKDFSHFNVLQATIERVKEWAQDGLLLVGDSAHTRSPAGAIGVYAHPPGQLEKEPFFSASRAFYHSENEIVPGPAA